MGLLPQLETVIGTCAAEVVPKPSRTVTVARYEPPATSAMKKGAASVVEESVAVLPAGRCASDQEKENCWLRAPQMPGAVLTARLTRSPRNVPGRMGGGLSAGDVGKRGVVRAGPPQGLATTTTAEGCDLRPVLSMATTESS